MSLTSEQAGQVYAFDEFRLDPAERVLTRGGEAVALTPKAFDTLLVLVSNSGRLVEKARLLDEVWPDTFVEEKTLAQNIFLLRKALGADRAGGQYIQTVPRHGYRFVADVRAVRREEVTSSSSPAPVAADDVAVEESGARAPETVGLKPPPGVVLPAPRGARTTTTSGRPLIFFGLLRRCRRWAFFLLAGLVAAVGVLFGLRDEAADRFQRMKIANLTVPKDCKLRRVKYLNNVIEQDHRFVKKRVRASQCFKRFHTAERTLEGVEAVNMMRKGQVKRLAGRDARGQATFVASLSGIVA
jgi:DNA-binding winged helix-turn-helix (wHTH) protein